MFERFTDRARKVFALADQEAQRFNHEYIGTEHIFLGLVKEGNGVGAVALHNVGIDRSNAIREVERVVRSGPDQVIMGRLPQTPRAKKVVEFAIENARKLSHNYVGTEHLLLGLMDEDGIAAQVIKNMGINKLEITTEVGRLLGTKALDADNCKLCKHFAYCYITQTFQYNWGLLSACSAKRIKLRECLRRSINYLLRSVQNMKG